MLTVFHLIQFIVALFCLIEGIQIGNSYFGWSGIFGGALLGGLVGLYLGRIPYWVSLFFFKRTLNRADTQTLKERLKKEYFVSHLIISELSRRGESVEQFRNYIIAQLQSANSNERRFGWFNLKLWFPELATDLAPFDAEKPTQEHVKTLNLLQTETSGDSLKTAQLWDN
jgi:hypothetical protein